jgi:hypothetical protein
MDYFALKKRPFSVVEYQQTASLLPHRNDIQSLHSFFVACVLEVLSLVSLFVVCAHMVPVHVVLLRTDA